MSEAELPPRLFANAGDVRAIARGLLARDLPRERWTHEAHLAAIVCILVEYPEILPERDMSVIISSYNVAAGGVNDDTQGYHETMTRIWIHIARNHIAVHDRANDGAPGGCDLVDLANALISGPDGDRGLPLRHYSRELLFSREARRSLVAPDLLPLPVTA